MKNRILTLLVPLLCFASTALAQGEWTVKNVPLNWLRYVSGADAFHVGDGSFQQSIGAIDGRHNSSNMTAATSIALQDTSQWVYVGDHILHALVSNAVGASGPLGVPDSAWFGTLILKSGLQTAGAAGIMDTLVLFRDYSFDGVGSTFADSITSHCWTDSVRVPGVVAVDSITITACPTLAVNGSGQVIRYFSYSWPGLPSVATMTSKGASPLSTGFNYVRFRVKLTGGDLVAIGSNSANVIHGEFQYPAVSAGYNK